MKYLTLIILLLSTICYCQNTDSISADSVCKVRGHIPSRYCMVTLMGWAPQYVDEIDRTLIISHDPNIATYYCLRCGKEFKKEVQVKPDTVIVWKKD